MIPTEVLVKVHLEEKEGETLCALCKAELSSEPTRVCSRCRVTVHQDCLEEIGSPFRCTNQNCQGKWVGPGDAPEPEGFEAPPEPHRTEDREAITPPESGLNRRITARSALVGAAVALLLGLVLGIPALRRHALLQRGQNEALAVDDIPALVDLLGESDHYARRSARNGLVRLGPKGAPEILRSVDRARPLACSRTADLLHAMGPQVIPALLTAEKSGSPNAQWVAAMALGKFRNQSPQAPLPEHE